MLRFVPTAVMTGFVSAVGVNIVLGQLSNFSGYESDAANRVLRALDLLLHPWRADLASLAVGSLTVLLILYLERTRLGSSGLVVAVAKALRQLRGEGLVDQLGEEHVYLGTEWLGKTLRRAYNDAISAQGDRPAD
jgi:MFS superfamily sulfate permease-like transporter